MSITIEIYPQKRERNVLYKIKEQITESIDYREYANNLEFVNEDIKVNDFIFKEIGQSRSFLSTNKIISPYCKALFINSYKIDDTISARDIVEDLIYINKEPVTSDFILKFEAMGEYYSLISKAGRSENEIKLMILIASMLSNITEGLIYFIEGGKYFGFEGNYVYNCNEFYEVTKKKLLL